MTRTQVPAVAGWFTLDASAPHLLASRCITCGQLSFPPVARVLCPRPGCSGSQFELVELGRTGRIWSYTDARYKPPPPYIPRREPFEPFALAAVEIDQDQLVVLGQVVPGVSVDELSIGQPVELVLDTLYSDGEHDYLIWKWKPQ